MPLQNPNAQKRMAYNQMNNPNHGIAGHNQHMMNAHLNCHQRGHGMQQDPLPTGNGQHMHFTPLNLQQDGIGVTQVIVPHADDTNNQLLSPLDQQTFRTPIRPFLHSSPPPPLYPGNDLFQQDSKDNEEAYMESQESVLNTPKGINYNEETHGIIRKIIGKRVKHKIQEYHCDWENSSSGRAFEATWEKASVIQKSDHGKSKIDEFERELRTVKKKKKKEDKLKVSYSMY